MRTRRSWLSVRSGRWFPCVRALVYPGTVSNTTAPDALTEMVEQQAVAPEASVLHFALVQARQRVGPRSWQVLG